MQGLAELRELKSFFWPVMARRMLILCGMLKKVSYSDLDLTQHPMTREGLKAAQTLVGLVESNLWRGIRLDVIAIAFEEIGYEIHFTAKEYVAFAKAALERAILATNKMGEFGPRENPRPPHRPAAGLRKRKSRTKASALHK